VDAESSKLDQLLRGYCMPPGGAPIRTEAALAGLATRVEQWYAERLPELAPESSAATRLALLARLIRGRLHESGEVTSPMIGQVALEFLHRLPILPAGFVAEDQGWPVTVQGPLDRLRESLREVEVGGSRPDLHAQVTATEAFLHTHFAALAGRWRALPLLAGEAAGEAQLGAATALLQGLKARKCFGLTDWLDWAALLSKANRERFAAGPGPAFPALDAILEPERIRTRVPESVGGRRRLAPDNRGVRWVESGGDCYDALRFWCVDLLRNTLLGHGQSRDLRPLVPGLRRLAHFLMHLFAPYRGLAVALVETRTLDGRPWPRIAAAWLDNRLRLADYGDDCRYIASHFNQMPPPAMATHLPAPNAPANLTDPNTSLLLFDPRAAYREFLYLLPLGAEHGRSAGGRRPGLLESVRWREGRPHCALQRGCDDALPLTPDWRDLFRASPEPPPETLPPDHDRIDREYDEKGDQGQLLFTVADLVQDLERRFGFDLGTKSDQAGPVPEPRRVDLGHDDHARRLADNSVARPQEVERLHDAALAAPHRRLLLVGHSGIGKSVLLAQLRVRLGERAVYFAMDQAPPLAPEPDRRTGPGAELASLAPPVRTHLVAGLCRLAGRPQPLDLLPLVSARSELAACLAALGDEGSDGAEPVWILIDGLNQATLPVELLDALPETLPGHLRLVASTQPLPFILDMVEATDAEGQAQRPWQHIEAPTLGESAARAILAAGWRAAAPEGDPPPDLPEDLVRLLMQRSRGLPVFLADWAPWLRQTWSMQGHRWGPLVELVRGLSGDPFPPAYGKRLDQALAGHRVPWLPAAALAVLALVGEPMDGHQLARALGLLRPRLTELKDARLHLDAAAPARLEAADAVGAMEHLGGFVQAQDGEGATRFALVHEQLGRWYLKTRVEPAALPGLRTLLAPLGADPLADAGPDAAESADWLADLDGGWDGLMQLPPRQRLRLLQQLSVGVSDYQQGALVLAAMARAYFEQSPEDGYFAVVSARRTLELIAYDVHDRRREQQKASKLLHDLIKRIRVEQIAPESVIDAMEFVMKVGHIAAHPSPIPKSTVRVMIDSLEGILGWYLTDFVKRAGAGMH
jgi:hypothetical protein